MRKLIFFILLTAFQFVSAQESNFLKPHTTTYKYGYNGMEYIVTSKKETVIVSTYNSKFDIKDEIAQKVYNYYKDNKDNCLRVEDTLTIDGKNAKVTGKYHVTKKGKLIAVEFYYEKIEWNNGLTELYKKNLG